MRTYALLVGINDYPGTENDLAGCINDVNDFATILWDLYHWEKSKTTLLIDAAATKKNIVDELGNIVAKAKPEDRILFHYSGHGSQVPDKNGDETDHKDEIICPYDLDWDDPLSDDVLRDIFKQKADGVLLTCIFDSCHSATMSRTMMFRKKFLVPPERFEIECNVDLPTNRMGVKQISYQLVADDQDHLTLSACKSNQTASDARFKGRPNGAWTYFLCQTIRRIGADAKAHDVFMNAYSSVRNNGFDQRPQLDGANFLREMPFLGGPIK